mmetsp:Transcript_20149/g.43981  ORF Transcript_20149/g.43981 Transcript_20149/m.43981 type:complete len:98 (+) Transcript_20149:641-934(+)
MLVSVSAKNGVVAVLLLMLMLLPLIPLRPSIACKQMRVHVESGLTWYTIERTANDGMADENGGAHLRQGVATVAPLYELVATSTRRDLRYYIQAEES